MIEKKHTVEHTYGIFSHFSLISGFFGRKVVPFPAFIITLVFLLFRNGFFLSSRSSRTRPGQCLCEQSRGWKGFQKWFIIDKWTSDVDTTNTLDICSLFFQIIISSWGNFLTQKMWVEGRSSFYIYITCNGTCYFVFISYYILLTEICLQENELLGPKFKNSWNSFITFCWFWIQKQIKLQYILKNWNV